MTLRISVKNALVQAG